MCSSDLPPAVVPTGPAITVDFAPLPNRTVYAQYKSDMKMAMQIDASDGGADAPKTTVKKADVTMAIALGTRQTTGGRAKDGSMTLTDTTESFSMDVRPDEIAQMMQDEIADLDTLVGTRTISRVNTDGSYDLIRVEPPKGKKLSDFSQRQNEVDQWTTQIPHGKHTLRVGESLSMKVNYPSQGGMMPMALDMELVFTLAKIDGQLATFDIAPKIHFEGDNPMFKEMKTTGGGALVFDTKRHLAQDFKLTLKFESNAEMAPGMLVHTAIEAVANGAESLKPPVRASDSKKAGKKSAAKAKQQG